MADLKEYVELFEQLKGGEYGLRCHYRISNSIRKLYTIKESNN